MLAVVNRPSTPHYTLHDTTRRTSAPCGLSCDLLALSRRGRAVLGSVRGTRGARHGALKGAQRGVRWGSSTELLRALSLSEEPCSRRLRSGVVLRPGAVLLMVLLGAGGVDR